jgi:hypothetical protein
MSLSLLLVTFDCRVSDYFPRLRGNSSIVVLLYDAPSISNLRTYDFIIFPSIILRDFLTEVVTNDNEPAPYMDQEMEAPADIPEYN